MPDTASRWGRWRVLRLGITLLFLVGVPVVVIAARAGSGTSPNASKPKVTNNTIDRRTNRTHRSIPHVPAGPAVSALDAAISKTIDAGNYDLTFSFGRGSDPSAVASGSGLADLDPQGLSVNVQTHCTGKVSARIDGANAWLDLGGWSDPSGSPATASGGWRTFNLVGFQGEVSLCFGPEITPLATIEMASPEGMLALSQQAIAGATPAGTVTVDGEAATEYDVTIDPAGLLQQPSSTAAENQAIAGALAKIGTSPMTATIDVDALGYIVRLVLAVSYPGGLVVTHTVVLSNFGHAGTIQFPPVGRTSGGIRPIGCNLCGPSTRIDSRPSTKGTGSANR